MNTRRFASLVMGALMALAFLFVPSSAFAVPPLTSLDGLITDQAGVLEGETDAVAEAQARFHEATGGNFYIVIMDSFDGMNQRQWAEVTGQNAGLESRDILMVVAINDTVTGQDGQVYRGTYWLQHGGDLQFTAAQERTLGGVIDNSLDAALGDVAPWGAAIANIVGAAQNEVVSGNLVEPGAEAGDETTVQGTEPAPEGVVNDGAVDDSAVAPAPAATSGGLPTAARVALIALGALAALFALWLMLGKYNEKRLAKRAEQNPFNFS